MPECHLLGARNNCSPNQPYDSMHNSCALLKPLLRAWPVAQGLTCAGDLLAYLHRISSVEGVSGGPDMRGVRRVELDDAYLRIDEDIARLVVREPSGGPQRAQRSAG